MAEEPARITVEIRPRVPEVPAICSPHDPAALAEVTIPGIRPAPGEERHRRHRAKVHELRRDCVVAAG
jgi:hypothetical protein